jgi:hypothetical protein
MYMNEYGFYAEGIYEWGWCIFKLHWHHRTQSYSIGSTPGVSLFLIDSH